jgi:hypothetical protein
VAPALSKSRPLAANLKTRLREGRLPMPTAYKREQGTEKFGPHMLPKQPAPCKTDPGAAVLSALVCCFADLRFGAFAHAAIFITPGAPALLPAPPTLPNCTM